MSCPVLYCSVLTVLYSTVLYCQARDLGQLGTADADVLEIESRALFSAEELRTKAEAAMQRRLETGISDAVEDQQDIGAPAFDQALVGKRIEVLWKYFHKDTNEPHLIWAGGRVVRVADGLTDTRSPRAKKILPGGALLWAWDADPERGEKAGERWLILLPQKWRKQQVYSWRWDPSELPGMCAAGVPVTPAQKRQNLRSVECEPLTDDDM